MIRSWNRGCHPYSKLLVRHQYVTAPLNDPTITPNEPAPGCTDESAWTRLIFSRLRNSGRRSGPPITNDSMHMIGHNDEFIERYIAMMGRNLLPTGSRVGGNGGQIHAPVNDSS